MTGNQHIRERHQTQKDLVVEDFGRAILVEERALLLIHVDRQPAQLPRLESRDDGAGVDEAAARAVDEHCARLHPVERRLVDHVAGGVHERAVQRDDVRLLQQRVELDVLAVLLELRDLERVVRQESAAEAVQDLSGCQPNLARADDAHGLAVHGEAEQTIEVEVALAHSVEGAVRFAVKRLD